MQIDLTGADVIDAHCHPFRTQDLLDREPRSVRDAVHVPGHRADLLEPREPDLAAFVEELTETTMFGLALRRWIAEHLGCEPTKDAVVAARDAALRADPPGYVRGLLESEQIVAVVADEGYPQPTITRDEFEIGARRRAGASRRPDRALDRRRSRGGNVRRPRAAVRGRWCTAPRQRPAPDRRTRRSSPTARAWTSRIRRPRTASRRSSGGAPTTGVRSREHAKPVRDFLLRRAFAIAKEHDRVFHVHVGAGDPDVNLTHAKPAGRVLVLRREPGHPDRDDPLGMALGGRGHLRRTGAAERLHGRLRARAVGMGADRLVARDDPGRGPGRQGAARLRRVVRAGDVPRVGAAGARGARAGARALRRPGLPVGARRRVDRPRRARRQRRRKLHGLS